MSHRALPREQLKDQPRFRLFEIGVPDDADGGWAAEVVGGMTDAEAEAWNAGRLAGADPFGRALRAVDAVARWDDTDAGFIWRLGVALSAPAAAVLGRLVGDECLFVPVEVEAGASAGSGFCRTRGSLWSGCRSAAWCEGNGGSTRWSRRRRWGWRCSGTAGRGRRLLACFAGMCARH